MTDAEAREALFAHVSRETSERLEIYHAALLKWQRSINLVAPASIPVAWHRHFLDSAQVFDAAPVAEGRWLDIGSGGGFPGLVCAILASERAPAFDFTLIESDIRKCAFLREVSRQCGLRVGVLSRRIEDAPPHDAAIVSARALAPLDRLLSYADRHLAAGGHCLFQKGAMHADELATARTGWQMDVETLPSVTSDDAAILRIGNLSHA